jgi:hypothetical protein
MRLRRMFSSDRWFEAQIRRDVLRDVYLAALICPERDFEELVRRAVKLRYEWGRKDDER